MVSAIDWWNPSTWLQNVAGFFRGAYDAGGAVLNALGAVLTILRQFFRFFFDTGHFIADAVTWMTNALFPPELQTWFLGTIGQPGTQWNSAHVYESLYRGMVPPALMIAAVAAAGRIMRALVDHRTGAMETTLSVMPRFLVAVAIIGVPGTQVSIGYSAIAWTVDASIAVARAIVGLILHASLLNGLQPGQGWLTHVFTVLAFTSHDMVAVVIGGIPLLVLVLYAAFLMIVRTVMLGFCIVTAPLCLATAVFDTSNRFFHWWLDLLGSVLLTPLVLGIAIALSLTLASHVMTAAVVGPLLAVGIVCGVIAGHDPPTSVAPDLVKRLQYDLQPFLDRGDAMRPDFGAFGDLRVEGELLESSTPMLATLEFDDRCSRETANGRVIPARARRLRITMHVGLEPVRIIDCAVAEVSHRG
jgi:hypothetical protein